jgi:hypothetical protein
VRENGRFEKGHKKIGGFIKGSRHSEESLQKIRTSLKDNKRRWKGDDAGYVAKHMWIRKHFELPDRCERCKTTAFSRLEWANVSGQHKRERSDYMALCPSCHRLMDIRDKCRMGHTYTPLTTYINIRGHRRCLICKAERDKINAKANYIQGMDWQRNERSAPSWRMGL